MQQKIVLCLLLLFSLNMQAKDFLVTRGDVKPDGTTLNTESIQRLIDEAHQTGGGRLVFPKGRFLTGSLLLKSNVELHFSKGAVLLGSTDPADYKSLEVERTGDAHRNDYSKLALIVAYKATDISITGAGMIDGQGQRLALNIDSLHHAGLRVDPNYNYRRMRPNETARPKLFFMMECERIKVTGLELRNSACWGLTFDSCRRLELSTLRILNRAYWNNDGIDITDCKRVTVNDCDVNSADDGICLKSYDTGSCNDTVSITNCVIRSSGSAIKFGTASHGGFKHVTIDNIRVFDTFRSAIAIESVDGGAIDNISVSNVVAKNTGNAIFIRLGHRSGETPGSLRNVSIRDMKVEVPFGRPDINYDLRGPEVGFFHNSFPTSITGIPGYAVENVCIENVSITYPGRASRGMAYVPLNRLNQVPEQIKEYPEFSMFGELPAWGFYVRHVKGLILKNVHLHLKADDYRPAFVLDDVQGLSINDLWLPRSKSEKQIILKSVTDGHIEKSSLIKSVNVDVQSIF